VISASSRSIWTRTEAIDDRRSMRGCVSNNETLSMVDASNYHGYDTDFDWDRRFFIPFIRNFCLYYKFIPLLLGIIMNWLIIFKSPSYSNEYRRSLAFYHIAEFVFDIHHFILFVPYPIFPHPIFLCFGLLCELGGPPNLTVILTVVSAVFTAISNFLLIFIRMRTIVPKDSRFRLTMRQSVIIMGSMFAFYLVNILTFSLFTRDSENKTEILKRSEFAWVNEAPGALVFGEMFELGPLNIPIGWLSFCVIYGFIMFPGIIIYTAVSLAKEKTRIVHVKKTKDNATKMLMIQLFGAVFTYISPLFVFFATLKFGMPTSNPNFHSSIRFFWMFLFLNNSMVCYSIHLVMNRSYQK
ncbi:hypothetical protein PENTCL1PPCAC_14215, partial [Pristionchus entomophagus]